MHLIILAQTTDRAADDGLAWLVAIIGSILTLAVIQWISVIAKQARLQTKLLTTISEDLKRGIAAGSMRKSPPPPPVPGEISQEQQERMRAESESQLGKKLAARKGF